MFNRETKLNEEDWNKGCSEWEKINSRALFDEMAARAICRFDAGKEAGLYKMDLDFGQETVGGKSEWIRCWRWIRQKPNYAELVIMKGKHELEVVLYRHNHETKSLLMNCLAENNYDHDEYESILDAFEGDVRQNPVETVQNTETIKKPAEPPAKPAQKAEPKPEPKNKLKDFFKVAPKPVKPQKTKNEAEIDEELKEVENSKSWEKRIRENTLRMQKKLLERQKKLAEERRERLKKCREQGGGWSVG